MALETLYGAVKETVVMDYGSITRFKTNFQSWLNGAITYGLPGTDSLRSYALQFTLSRREFADALNEWFRSEGSATRYGSRANVVICPRCTHLEWEEMQGTVRNGHHDTEHSAVCSKCTQTYYRECAQCGNRREITLSGAPFVIPIRNYAHVCMDCIISHPETFAKCRSCMTYHAIQNHRIFRYDQDARTAVYTHNDTGGTVWLCTNCHAPEQSRCKPLHPEFSFPALALGQDRTVAQDEKFEISHGGGDVSATGLQEIYQMIVGSTMGHGGGGVQLADLINPEYGFDSRYQTKEGNFPKRVAKLLINLHNLKLTESLMSEIGNIAQRYTSKPGTYRLSITRNLNLPRTEFVNGDSCWWSSYWWSRCNLKSLGGFGLRTWEMGRYGEEKPVGRAWMVPLGLTRGVLVPAPEALPAEAYVVFNGYGPHNTRLDSLEFARMVALLTGKSYRKIDFMVNHHLMYINGTNVGSDSVGKGVLVAEQSICDATSSLTIRAIPNRCTCPGKPA